MNNAKKEISKIHFDSKNILNKDIQSKKEMIEKEIDKEVLKAQKEILTLKKFIIVYSKYISKYC